MCDFPLLSVLQLSDTPRQDRCHNLLNALNSHKDRYVAARRWKNKHQLHAARVMNESEWGAGEGVGICNSLRECDVGH